MQWRPARFIDISAARNHAFGQCGMPFQGGNHERCLVLFAAGVNFGARQIEQRLCHFERTLHHRQMQTVAAFTV